VIDAASHEQAQRYIRTHDPALVRKVRLELTTAAVLRRSYKRFAVWLSPSGLDLTGRQCQYEEGEER
jgi:hypothetical protein